MQPGREQLAEWIARQGHGAHGNTRAAGLFGIHPVYLWQILNGKRRPGRDLSVMIQEFTGIPVKAWGRAFDKRKATKGKQGEGNRKTERVEAADKAGR